MAIAFGFQYNTSMKTLDPHSDWTGEKVPTIASCKMNGAWTYNNFLLGSNPPFGSIASLARFKIAGGLGVEWLIKSFML